MRRTLQDGTPTRRPLHRAPLVPAALALMGGIVAGRYMPFPTGLWFWLAGAAAVVAVAAFRRPHLRAVTCVAAGVVVASLGAAHLRVAMFHMPDDHVAGYTGRTSILATLRGRVVTAPQIVGGRGGASLSYARPPQTRLILQATGVRTESGYASARGLIRVTIEEPARHLAAGQEIELVGRIGRFGPPRNPGEYDHRAAARRNGTFIWMTVPAAAGATVLGGGDRPWHRRVYWHVRAAARQHLTACAGPDDAHLLSALIVGERHPGLRDLNRTMARAGLAHFLSISGLHLGVFLGFVFLLCRLCLLTPRRSAGVVLVVLAAYVLLAEPRAPLLRSAIMAALLCVGTILGRRHMVLNVLAAAAVVLLALEPAQLFSAGFQLSFGIVAGIVVFHRRAKGWLFGRWLRRRGLRVFRDEPRWRRWVSFSVTDRLMDMVALCGVAYLVAAPLVAYHFGLFSPYAPLLSLLIFPVVLAVLVPGYVSVALAWPLPNLSYQIGRLAGSAAGALEAIVSLLDHLPALSVELRPLSVAWVALCYAALTAVAFRRRLPLGRSVALTCVVGLAAATAWSQWPAGAPSSAELNVLAVGAGQCVVLRTPDGRTWLIDAGTQGRGDLHDRTLAPFLRDRRLPRPEAAFVSHANSDHYNAIPGALAAGGVETVYLNDYFGVGRSTSPGAARLMQVLDDREVRVVRLHAGQRVELDRRTVVEVLWPPAEQRDGLSVNDTSLVLRITCDNRSVLLPGDLDALGQAELAATGGIGADVLVLPHHGGWEEPLPAFVEAVGPRTVVVSGPRDPTGPVGSPVAREFYTRLKRTGRWYPTALRGWVRVRFGREGVQVDTMR